MRPAVLLVEPNVDKRRAFSLGLAEHGYELVPVRTAAEALRFARGLGPSVIVAPATLEGFGDGAILERFAVQDRTMRRTLLLLGTAAEQADSLPEDVLFLDVSDLAPTEVVRRLRRVLVAREIGLEPDLELETLVGDLALLPFLELLRALNRVFVSGRLQLAGGHVDFERGQVVAARAGRATGVKAVCRLSRRADGPCRLLLGMTGQPREIDVEFFDLMIRAIEEAQIAIPDLRARPRVVGNVPGLEGLSAREQALLVAVDRCETVAELLDALPASDGRVAQVLDRLVTRGHVRLHKPLPGVAVVTDSTCDLPAQTVSDQDLSVVPLTVCFGSDRFRDGVDITARDFYELLESGGVHPSTEPPPDVEFAERFRQLGRRQSIVSVHISEKLSQTVVHARRAARLSVDAPERGTEIEVVDTRSVSVGVGLLALFASRMAHRGHSASAVAARIRALREHMHVYFVVDTLDYLVRGGRIGKARAAVGKLLGIKPILGMVDGEIHAIDRVRGGRRAHPRIAELIAERTAGRERLAVAVAHARAPVWADRLGHLLRERFTLAELVSTDIGPVVGTHAGPGCVGCAVIALDEAAWAEVGPIEDASDALDPVTKPVATAP